LGDNIILCQEALGRVWVNSAVQVFVVSLPDDKMEKELQLTQHVPLDAMTLQLVEKPLYSSLATDSPDKSL
jgi:hypothetical protein